MPCTTSGAPPSSPKELPAAHAFTSPLITIEVGFGENQRNFHIRKDVLRFYPGYFAAALSGHFVEAQNGVCRLTEEDPLIFELFQHWIHVRTLYESTLEPAALMTFESLAKLWIFADAHAVPTLQNHALDAFARKPWLTGKPVTEICGLYIFDNTVESSPLNRLLRTMIERVIPGTVTLLAGQTWESIVKALPETEERRRYHQWAKFKLSAEELCAFHVHEDGVSCCKVQM